MYADEKKKNEDQVKQENSDNTGVSSVDKSNDEPKEYPQEPKYFNGSYNWCEYIL